MNATVAWSYQPGELDRAADECLLSLAASADVSTKAAAVAEDVLGHVARANGDPDGARNRFINAGNRFRQLAVEWKVGHSLAAGDDGRVHC